LAPRSHGSGAFAAESLTGRYACWWTHDERERLMGSDDDPGSRDTKFAFTGMALVIFVLIVVSILS
jgi:hypothetical protein